MIDLDNYGVILPRDERMNTGVCESSKRLPLGLPDKQMSLMPLFDTIR
jgi:hypothetical protein